jgi:hypothetical protein
MSTEDTVRDALADLAPRVPAGDQALAGVRRAITRRRRRRAVARTGVAAVLLAAVATAGVVAVVSGNEPSETDMGTPTTTTTEPVAPGGRLQFGPVSLDLPDGWVERFRVPGTGTDGASESLCIGPAAGEPPVGTDCAGLMLHRGYLPGHETFSYEEEPGWSQATDVEQCPTGDGVDDVVVTGPQEASREEDDRPVGDKDAEWTEWAAECSSGATFTPEAWLLPDVRVLVVEVLDRDETEEILASFEFTDE